MAKMPAAATDATPEDLAQALARRGKPSRSATGHVDPKDRYLVRYAIHRGVHNAYVATGADEGSIKRFNDIVEERIGQRFDTEDGDKGPHDPRLGHKVE